MTKMGAMICAISRFSNISLIAVLIFVVFLVFLDGYKDNRLLFTGNEAAQKHGYH